jgi:hypothetical protein
MIAFRLIYNILLFLSIEGIYLHLLLLFSVVVFSSNVVYYGREHTD